MANRSKSAKARRAAVTAPPPKHRGRLFALLAGAAVVVVAAFILISNVVRNPDSDFSTTGSAGSGPDAPASTVHVKGQDSAPVTIVQYYDLQCPNCAVAHANVDPRIEADYISTGKVRMEFRHFPFLGKESTRAAIATECANEQGRFWEYRDGLFRNQRGENQGRFSDDNLERFAGQLSMNSKAFGACLNSGRYDDALNRDLAAGKAAGVQGTPSYLINGTMIFGAYPYETFKAVIEQVLAAAQR